MDFTPTVLHAAELGQARLELVEWHWLCTVDFERREERLMLEMSLPPYSGSGSACFPDRDPHRHCFLGSLFLRWPGVVVRGRSGGGRIRVVRFVFDAGTTRRFAASRTEPDMRFLQSLLAIRSETLRTLMHLSLRELTLHREGTQVALAALADLVTVELERLFAAPVEKLPQGRLAGWQLNRIRERIGRPGPLPAVSELARLCGISTRHLHRQFHALTGSTVADYAQATRIETAKGMLVSHDEPIGAIALSCGFAHANSFARAFRRSTGMSPTAYRRQAETAPTRH